MVLLDPPPQCLDRRLDLLSTMGRYLLGARPPIFRLVDAEMAVLLTMLSRLRQLAWVWHGDTTQAPEQGVSPITYDLSRPRSGPSAWGHDVEDDTGGVAETTP